MYMYMYTYRVRVGVREHQPGRFWCLIWTEPALWQETEEEKCKRLEEFLCVVPLKFSSWQQSWLAVPEITSTLQLHMCEEPPAEPTLSRTLHPGLLDASSSSLPDLIRIYSFCRAVVCLPPARIWTILCAERVFTPNKSVRVLLNFINKGPPLRNSAGKVNKA